MKKDRKEITELNIDIYHVLSEPGDATRYNYIVFEDYDNYSFMPCKNSFRYPQRLNYWDIKDLDEGEEIKVAEETMCNLFTLRECIRTIKELRNKRKLM